MRVARKLLAAAAACAIAACGSPPAGPQVPTTKGGDPNADLRAALELEARGDQTKAARAYVDVLTRSMDANDPYAVARVVASLDALVDRDAFPGMHGALYQRTTVDLRADLERAYERGKGPFTRGLVARILAHLYGENGDPQTTEKWRARTGCARGAAMYGPVSWSSVLAASEPDPLADPSKSLPAEVPSDVALAPSVKRVDYSDRGCFLGTAAVSDDGGAREVVIDVDVPKAQKIAVALRTKSAAVLRAQGRPVLSRGYDEGGEMITKYATLDSTKGTVRLAVRVGHEIRDQGIELYAWSADGAPLASHAPAAGATADARVSNEAELAAPISNTNDLVVASLFGLASGRGRSVERLLSQSARPAGAPGSSKVSLSDADKPVVAWLTSRSLGFATDLPPVERAERERAAIEKVLEAWPDAWEAVQRHASLAASRKGAGEAKLEALGDLEEHAVKVPDSQKPLLALFEANLAGEARLWDRAGAALARAKPALGATALYFDVDRVARPRTSRETLDLLCGERPDKSDVTCLFALMDTAEWDRARAELARLRALYGAPKGFMMFEAGLVVSRQDREGAARLVKQALPGELSLAVMSLADDKAPIALAALKSASDSPRAVLGLESRNAKSPLASFDGRAEAAAAKSHTDKGGPNDAATTILDHEERYEVATEGVLKYVVFDVRRVGGTADVESNAAANAPATYGRDASRILRRRIFKKDGRILTPEQTPHAQQQHADLAQLETGDVVEAIYEGISVTGEMGELGFDTPDLLPSRTAVAAATITVDVPASNENQIVSHRLLGKATRTPKGDRVTLQWKLANAPVRRLEDGTPRMDRAVSVVFSTLTWKSIARAISETETGLDGNSPELDDIVADLSSLATEKEKIDKVVTLTGERLKQSVPSVLSDYEAQRPTSPQTMQLRTFLATHEGSRTFMAKKVLTALGISCEVVVAEAEPFSANPDFVAHIGRFTHPLLVVHASGGAKQDGKQDAKQDGKQDVWLDLDVPGPPLPAGRVSPELRGKNALASNGSISPLPAGLGEGERDEADLRLVLDKNGDAKGDFTILLRGRTAQDLAEAFERVVGDEREKVLRGVVLAWVPYASVDTVSLSSSEGSSQVAVRASLTVSGYAQSEGKNDAQRTWVLPGLDPIHYVFPRPYTTTLSATYATQAGRASALAIGRATLVHVHRRVELPQGAEPARVPGPFDVKKGNLAASRGIVVQKGTIEEDFQLSVRSGTVSAEDYGDLVRALHATDDAFLTSIRVKPPAK
jgi:hypothetical protein